MVTFRRLHHRLIRLSGVIPQKTLRKYEKCEKLCPTAPGTKKVKSQAVSDGELNMSARGCGGSSSSLPGTPGAGDPANSVLRWAVSFENLLEDPFGVRYFTAFLMSEVSAENILFWQACEKFKKIPATSLNELKIAARSMYNMYLSESAPYSVNIDDTVRVGEQDLEQPVPDMFNKAQAQIFKLMKMDSYRRFVRSPLYQSCTLTSVEGKPLPPLSSEANKGSRDNVNKSPRSDKKNRKSDFSGLRNKHEKRGSWGEVEASAAHILVSRKESQMSSKSTSSVELGSLYRQIENGRPSALSSDDSGRGHLGVEGGYCCVYLPDGSASLAPTRPGLPIRDMLQGLCEKRAFPLKDVIIYLHGKDKQPLSLDQDCAVLRDQQVSLELRVTFALEIVFTGKTVGIMVKSSKTLQDALSAVLQKHHLKLHEVQLSMAGSDAPVNMNTSVFKVANKTLRLDKAKGKDPNISKGGEHTSTTQAVTGTEGHKEFRTQSLNERNRGQPKPRKNRDMDGFLDMLTRAQCCRVDDQRGLLTKEQLEVPLFLQQSPENGAVKSDDTPPSPHPADEENPDSKNQESPTEENTKDVRETDL
ncbi:regulator of G-protein signaling 14-like isoform X2 [Periophthalmus magnuspinnatus]|uniref:regulator of G-protein signaling 14-like isoform X2 n=1 Tax=Periophthalmus magnuspinnatus TaxID=409849 RepID=UPI00243655F5|nr:regulator of G-protein signaling 14-like isoform X2 [Periophthalmus magnuspinnatus]